MRHAITSILKAISNARVAMVDGRQVADAGLPMVQLGFEEMRQVVGGDDPTLPKGGWKAA